MTEWFKVTVLKTVVGQLTASSNLALSAKHSDPIGVVLFGGGDSGSRVLHPQNDREFGVMSEMKKCLHFFMNEWRSEALSRPLYFLCYLC